MAETCTGTFDQKETASFFDRLKMHFISFLVYPRVFTKNPNFALRIGEVPTVMDPRVTGSTLFNTEYQASFFHLTLWPLQTEKVISSTGSTLPNP